MGDAEEHEAGPARQPVFLVPGVVTALVGLMWAIHIGSSLVLDSDGLANLRIWFGFIPFRLTASELLPGGAWPLLWTGFTHAFLHVDFMHLIVNSAWLAVFGTPVARRYGIGSTLAVFLLGALAGAALHTVHHLTDVNQFSILIGASGGVSALTGAALRFVFQPVIVKRDSDTGEPVIMGRRTATFAELFKNVRSRVFIIFWVGGNLVIGFAPLIMGVDVPIAWDAHIGGFVAGLMLPALFDRRAQGTTGAR